jgi:hypothetical protein
VVSPAKTAIDAFILIAHALKSLSLKATYVAAQKQRKGRCGADPIFCPRIAPHRLPPL